jgi:hypothetical protein
MRFLLSARFLHVLRRISLFVLVGLLAASTVHAQSVSVSVPDTSGVEGDTVSVPVRVSGLDPTADVTSFGFELDIAQDDRVGYAGVSTQGTLAGQAGFTVDDNADVPRIGGFGSSALSSVASSGVLVRLNLVVRTPGTSRIALSALQFNGGSSPAADPSQPAFTFTSLEPNQAPLASQDRYETLQDNPLTVDATDDGVLANDRDPNGEALTGLLVDGVSNGQLSFQSDGTFTYTPDASFTGTDSFRYAASDPRGATDTATVRLRVLQPNTPPSLSVPESRTIPEDGSLGPVSISVSDAESAASEITVRVASSNPTLLPDDRLAVSGTGTSRTLSGAPVPDSSGQATLTVTARDGRDTTQAALAVTVRPVNDPPRAEADAYNALENDTLRVPSTEGLLANDSDPDDSPRAVLVSGADRADVSVEDNGSFTVRPDSAFTGTTAFEYAAVDDSSASDTARVEITVRSAAPVSVSAPDGSAAPGDTVHVPVRLSGLQEATPITAYSFRVTKKERGGARFIGVETDSTLSGAAGFTVETAESTGRVGAFGSTALGSVAGRAQGTMLRLSFVVPETGSTAVRIDRIVLNDGVPFAQPSALDVTVEGTFSNTNRAPTARDDVFTVDTGGALSVDDPSNGVLANDADPDSDPLEVSLVDGPSNGTFSLRSDGTLDYVPDSSFVGTARFTYQVTDPAGNTSTATGELQVQPPPGVRVLAADAPAAEDTVTVPVYVRRLDQAKDITSIGFELAYDTNLVTYVGVETAGTLLEKANFTVNDNPEVQRVGAYGAEPLNDVASSGLLIRLRFATDLPDGQTADETAITIENVQFDDGSPQARPTQPRFSLIVPVETDTARVETNTTVGFDETGMTVGVSGVGGSGTVAASRLDDQIDQSPGITAPNVGQSRFLIQAERSLSVGAGTTVHIPVSKIEGATDPTTITVYQRPIPGAGVFNKLETRYDSSADVLEVSTDGFGEFVVGSTTNPLPVDMAGLQAAAKDGTVRLTWQTTSESGNAGFAVQRRALTSRGEEWERVGFVDSKAPGGTTEQTLRYAFADQRVPFVADSLEYRLQQVDVDGSSTLSQAVTIRRTANQLRLLKPAPNPVRQSARIQYSVPKDVDASIRLYDLLGRQVRKVDTGSATGGRAKTTVDVSGLASGTYFLRLEAGNRVRTRRLTVVR